MAKAIHSMIRVLDLESSIEFYKNAFGLSILSKFDFEDFVLVYLKNEETDFEVELTKNKSRTEPYDLGDGYGHLAFSVVDCKSERDRLNQLGFKPGKIVEFFREEELFARFFFIQDPDGYKIEILERCGRFT